MTWTRLVETVKRPVQRRWIVQRNVKGGWPEKLQAGAVVMTTTLIVAADAALSPEQQPAPKTRCLLMTCWDSLRAPRDREGLFADVECSLSPYGSRQ